jgi:hypothetical protein
MGGRGGPRGRGNYGGGRFSDNGQNGFFQNQNQQSENPTQATVPTVQAENPPTEKPAQTTTQSSGNNVQVVTTNPPSQPATNGTVQPQQTAPSQQPSHISSGRGGFQGSRGGGFRGARTFGGRGRGYQGNQGPPRQFDTRQPSNLAQTQPNSYPTKRGGFQPGNGGPGAKRGRYEGPYQGSRNMAPHSQLPPPPPQSAYNVPP